jgi:hypothetical protein
LKLFFPTVQEALRVVQNDSYSDSYSLVTIAKFRKQKLEQYSCTGSRIPHPGFTDEQFEEAEAFLSTVRERSQEEFENFCIGDPCDTAPWVRQLKGRETADQILNVYFNNL